MKEPKAEPVDEQLKIPRELPVLPLRDIVVYPFIIVPLSVSRSRSIKSVERALAENRMILLVAQKDAETEVPGEKDIFNVGTVGVIMRMLKLPDGRIRVLVQGVCRARIDEFSRKEPYLEARITRIQESKSDSSLEQEARLRSTKKLLERSVSLGKAISSEVMVIAGNLEDPGRLADLVASNLDLKSEDAQLILKTVDSLARLKKVHDFLSREIELLAMQQEINTHAREEIDKSQREYFLRQQLKAIQSDRRSTRARSRPTCRPITPLGSGRSASSISWSVPTARYPRLRSLSAASLSSSRAASRSASPLPANSSPRSRFKS